MVFCSAKNEIRPTHTTKPSRIWTYEPNDAPAKTHQQYLFTNSLWTILHTIPPPRKETDSRTKLSRSEPPVSTGHWPSPPPSMTKPVARHHPQRTHDLRSGSQDHHPGAAFEGGKWGDCPRPRSWGGPALQAYEFVKLYSPVNWKCWYMLRLKSFFKVKFRSVGQWYRG